MVEAAGPAAVAGMESNRRYTTRLFLFSANLSTLLAHGDPEGIPFAMNTL